MKTTMVLMSLLLVSRVVYAADTQAKTLTPLIGTQGADAGKLLGAIHIQLPAGLYTVVFIDGTCAAVYQACANSNFAFHDRAGVDPAAGALISQVLVDSVSGKFNLHPALVRGCEGAEAKGIEPQCAVVTPYALSSTPGKFLSIYSVDSNLHNGNYTDIQTDVNADLTTWPQAVFGLWMPEPNAISDPIPPPPPVVLNDFNHDGKADILWRDQTDVLSLWYMDGTKTVTQSTIATVGPDWVIAGKATSTVMDRRIFCGAGWVEK